MTRSNKYPTGRYSVGGEWIIPVADQEDEVQRLKDERDRLLAMLKLTRCRLDDWCQNKNAYVTQMKHIDWCTMANDIDETIESVEVEI